MSDTTSPSSDDPPHIALALKFDDPFITSALGLAPTAKPKPMSPSPARKRDAGLLWLHEHEATLHHAFETDNQVEVQRLKGLLLDILDPQWPTWAYCAVYALGAVLAFVHPLPVRTISEGRTTAIMLALRACVPTLLFRTYHTFRSRILFALGYQPERPARRIQIIIDVAAEQWAIGIPAYRAAPLSAAWPGLTGKERGQPAWYRTFSLILVIIASTCLELILLPSVLALLTRTAFETAGRSIPSPRIGGLSIGFSYHQYSRSLMRLGLTKVQQLLNYVGYRWDARHPLVRGFTDQLLATYRLPNPTRDADFAHDATVAASASASTL